MGDLSWPFGVIDVTKQEGVSNRGANSESGCRYLSSHRRIFLAFAFFLPHMMMLGKLLNHGLLSPNGYESLSNNNNNSNNSSPEDLKRPVSVVWTKVFKETLKRKY